MCLYDQAPDEAADTINLSQKVSIATPEETAPAATEEDKALPEWSEKVASGILTGEVTLCPQTYSFLWFSLLVISLERCCS